MTPQLFIDNALTPALAMLPRQMDTPQARALCIAICLQESRLEHRYQVLNSGNKGAARGYPQFERIGIEGVLEHPASSRHIVDVLKRLDYDLTVEASYQAIEHHDILAVCYARLNLWSHPRALPTRDNVEGAWLYYLRCWKPGKPRHDDWEDNFETAWTLV